MQTRRDLLQAYRFQARRAVAALVTGQPNVAEPPTRRLAATTISGIMIAILVASGFALIGLLRLRADESRAHPARSSSYPQGRPAVRPNLVRYAPSRVTFRRNDVGQYTTSQEAMAQGATRVGEAAAQVQGVLGQMRAEVDTMMGGWRGEAASAFMQVHGAFEEQADRINNALRRMHEALLATHRTYSAQESTQTRALTGLAGQING